MYLRVGTHRIRAAFLLAATLFASCSQDSTDRPEPLSVGAGLGNKMTSRAVELRPDGVGWSVGTSGIVLTQDAGNTWVDVTPPQVSRTEIDTANFVDGRRGWLVLSEATAEGAIFEVWATRDGGRNWSSGAPVAVDGGELTDANSLSFADASHGWLLLAGGSSSNFSVGRLYATEDGGITWIERPAPAAGEVTFVDDKQGWIAGGPGNTALFTTQDGGSSWSRADVDPGAQLLFSRPPVRHEDGVLRLAASVSGEGAGVNFYESEDGARWTRVGHVDAQVDTFPLATAVPTARDWIVSAGGSGRMVATSSRGASWRDLPANGLASSPNRLSFADSQRGVGIAATSACPNGKESCQSAGLLVVTDDGGQTWTNKAPPPSKR